MRRLVWKSNSCHLIKWKASALMPTTTPIRAIPRTLKLKKELKSTVEATFLRASLEQLKAQMWEELIVKITRRFCV